MIKLVSFQESKNVSSVQISICNTAYKYNQGQISHDHFNRCRKKPLIKFNILHDARLEETEKEKNHTLT
jgi:hypothetical protein